MRRGIVCHGGDVFFVPDDDVEVVGTMTDPPVDLGIKSTQRQYFKNDRETKRHGSLANAQSTVTQLMMLG